MFGLKPLASERKTIKTIIPALPLDVADIRSLMCRTPRDVGASGNIAILSVTRLTDFISTKHVSKSLKKAKSILLLSIATSRLAC